MKSDLFEGRKVVFAVGGGKLEVAALGEKQQNTTKTGLILDVDVLSCASPSLLELVRGITAFLYLAWATTVSLMWLLLVSFFSWKTKPWSTLSRLILR